MTAPSPGTHTEDDSGYPLPYVENRTTSDICGSALAQLGDAWCYVDVYAEWLNPTHRTLQLIRKAPSVGTASPGLLLVVMRGTRSARLLPLALVHIAAPSLPHLHHVCPRGRARAWTGVKGHRLLATRIYDVTMAALPARGLSSERSQKKPEVLSFEKDLSYELASLKKLSSNHEDHVLRQRL